VKGKRSVASVRSEVVKGKERMRAEGRGDRVPMSFKPINDPEGRWGPGEGFDHFKRRGG